MRTIKHLEKLEATKAGTKLHGSSGHERIRARSPPALEGSMRDDPVPPPSANAPAGGWSGERAGVARTLAKGRRGGKA